MRRVLLLAVAVASAVDVHYDCNNWPSNIASDTTHIECNAQSLSGEIPEELFSLENLKVLDLSENQFTGSIPTNWSLLLSLEEVTMSENQLSGGLPQQFPIDSPLFSIDLSYNSFSGPLSSITDQAGLLSNLNLLLLNHNELYDTIPDELANLGALGKVDISNNQFHGCGSNTLESYCDDFGTFEGIGNVECNFEVQSCGSWNFPKCTENILCSISPTKAPTPPTMSPTSGPTVNPTISPSESPSSNPTSAPSTNEINECLSIEMSWLLILSVSFLQFVLPY